MAIIEELEGQRRGLYAGAAGYFSYDGSMAVSYTHLRAHETVLDLVCRLLLEKKKSNNTHQRVFLT